LAAPTLVTASSIPPDEQGSPPTSTPSTYGEPEDQRLPETTSRGTAPRSEVRADTVRAPAEIGTTTGAPAHTSDGGAAAASSDSMRNVAIAVTAAAAVGATSLYTARRSKTAVVDEHCTETMGVPQGQDKAE
jgi:hypothetical protein